MIKKNVNYRVNSSIGNEQVFTEKDLDQFTLLERIGDKIIFIYKNVRYEAKIVEHNDEFKKAQIIVNNQKLDLILRDELDQLVDRMGLSEVEDEDGGDVHSPMPGLVIKMLVKEGDAIQKGEPVLVLEAMKMENLLQAESSGIIQSIRCKEGDSVNKGDLLVSIETN